MLDTTNVPNLHADFQCHTQAICDKCWNLAKGSAFEQVMYINKNVSFVSHSSVCHLLHCNGFQLEHGGLKGQAVTELCETCVSHSPNSSRSNEILEDVPITHWFIIIQHVHL